MPGKKRARSKAPVIARPTSATAPHVPPGTTDFRHLLNTYIAGAPAPKTVKPSISPAAVARWQDPDLNTHQGQMINEVARKFNLTNSLGIGQVSGYGLAGHNNLYGADARGSVPTTNITLAPPPFQPKGYGPAPLTFAHEILHANDHQSKLPVDHLTPKIWGNLNTLATTGGAAGGPMANFGEFESSISKIQDKIDPTHHFGPFPGRPAGPRVTGKKPLPAVPPSPSPYPFNQAYMENEMRLYGTPKTFTSAPHWPTLFGDIQKIVSSPGGSGIPNEGFYFSRASEIPAYMFENFHNSWKTRNNTAPAGQPSNALSDAEALALHSSLRNVEESYTPDEFPVMNNYARQRRLSMEHASRLPADLTHPYALTPEQQAVNPPLPNTYSTGLPPGTPLLRGGGRVKAKRLSLSDYLCG